MTITIADIMTTPVITLTREATLKDAHKLTREKGIRHLPVVDPESQQVLAIVTQKAMIANVLSLLNQFGGEALAEREAQIGIMEVAISDFDAVKSDERVIDVASFFLENKHGCLPVVDGDGCLQGVITSSDFVKLSIRLLSATKG